MASLADIILQGGRDQANLALTQADIEARRRQANADTWGRSIATLGDAFAKIPQQIQQQKRQAVEDQANKLALDQQKQAVQGQADINQIIAGLKPNEDGVLTYDPAQLRQQFAAHNVPIQLQTQTFTALDGMNKSLAGFTQARIDHAADFSNSVLNAFPTGPIDPQSLALIMAPAKANGLLDDKTEKAITTAVQNGADPRALLTAFRDQSEKYKGKAVSVAPGASLVNDTTGAVIAQGAPKAKTQAELAADAANPQSPTQAQSAAALDRLHPQPVTSRQDKNLLLDGHPAVVSYDPKADKYYRGGQEIAVDRLKPIPAASTTGSTGPNGGLDPDAVDYTATQYRILGPGGIPTRIEGPDRVKILNTAAKQAKALGETPAQAVQKQAAFKADAASLTQMQKMASSADAFETKANAQADLIASLSNKVSRTTSPLFNSWLLSGKKTVLGDTNTQLLFNALDTFTTEYGKIMSGSTGSVAAGSDAATRKAEGLISAALGKGTLQSTIDQMKWEMNQTRNGYDAAIAHITDRMGGAPTPNTASQTPDAKDPLGILK